MNPGIENGGAQGGERLFPLAGLSAKNSVLNVVQGKPFPGRVKGNVEKGEIFADGSERRPPRHDVQYPRVVGVDPNLRAPSFAPPGD